jgi:NitT/TauT family transport system permease protein
LSRLASPLLGLVGILAAWQLTGLLLDAPTYLLPMPSDVVRAISENTEPLLRATLQTGMASMAGLALAVVLGLGGAVVLGFSRTLERTFFPYAVVLQTIPIVTIAPLIVLWTGPGLKAIIIVSLIISFFPMLSNTLVGLNSVEPERASLLRLYGASRWQVMRKLRLPGSMPYVMAGVRISGGLAIKGAILGEFVAGGGGGTGGLGYIVAVSARNIDTPYLVGAALVSASLGVAYYFIVRYSTLYLLAWHESTIAEAKERGAPVVGKTAVPALGGA